MEIINHFTQYICDDLRMVAIIFIVMLTIPELELYSQNENSLKFIFVPHPRSEDQSNQSVYKGIEEINFSEYDVTMLGGDITYSTGKDSATLAYCDNLFNLASSGTLWSFGNHDVQSRHRDLIKKFTQRESFYTYSIDKVTFVVLDTELNANSFSSTFIIDEQLQMVKDVCDTISESRYLIILHHRFMWMINNDYFKPFLNDSIAASSRSMDTTNFYSDIYPLLQKVKQKGVQVLVFGGDKAKINISYSPEDSITFYAARLAVDLPDNINNVIIMNYSLQSKELTLNFVPLDKLITSVIKKNLEIPDRFILYQNYPNPFNPVTKIYYSVSRPGKVSIIVYDIIGNVVATLVNEKNPVGYYPIDFDGSGLSSGVYFYSMSVNDFYETKKMVLLR